MKQFVFIAFVVVITIAASNAAEKYTNKFDNVDVDSILNNDRILNNYIKCLLEKGPCTQEGRELKSKLKCSPLLSKSHCARKLIKSAKLHVRCITISIGGNPLVYVKIQENFKRNKLIHT